LTAEKTEALRGPWKRWVSNHEFDCLIDLRSRSRLATAGDKHSRPYSSRFPCAGGVCPRPLLRKNLILPLCPEGERGSLRMAQSWAPWLKPVIPAQERLKEEDGEFKASLGYIARSSFQKKKNKRMAPK
jgi:hypothetical protein